MVQRNGRWIAFTGDLMVDGSKLHNWFDSEWDYGFAAGIYALCNSAGQVEGYDPEWMLPSHGPPIRDGARQLAEFQRKLEQFEKLYVRGYAVNTFSGSRQDPMSKPTSVPHLWQISPHLYKFRGPNFYPNFCMILSDGGRALLVDCGLFDEKFLDQSIELMKERLGPKQIDAMIPTHMHGDHMLQGPHIRKTWGAKLWAIDKMGPVCEHPEWFDYCAPIQAYGQMFEGKPIESVTFDRLFKDGESFEWEGFKFTIDWMPGQTEFALAVQGMIDGRKVVFTGDNLFGDPANPKHTGHECVVAHNSAVLEEGYEPLTGASTREPAVQALDLIIRASPYCMSCPTPRVGSCRATGSWAHADARRAVRRGALWINPTTAYDPFWVRVQPYRVKVRAGESGCGGRFVYVPELPVPASSPHWIEATNAAGTASVEPVSLPGGGARPPNPASRSKARGRGRRTATCARRGVHLIALDA
jgi:glyoxylase-like metal-dependent hydrolase (beta-lactamase superfamily II)